MKDRQTECSKHLGDSRADQQLIHIAIDTKGTINLETVGTAGNQCDTLAGALEANLGCVVGRINKDSYCDE